MRRALFAILPLFLIGCSPSAPVVAPTPADPDHGHAQGQDHSHDVPITKADVKIPATFAELVVRIETYRDQIEAAIEAGKPETGHRALDELDIVLEETMTLAQASVKEEQLAEVNEARQKIKNAFLELHQSIDAKEKPDYASKQPAIQGAIEKLKQFAASPAKSPE